MLNYRDDISERNFSTVIYMIKQIFFFLPVLLFSERILRFIRSYLCSSFNKFLCHKIRAPLIMYLFIINAINWFLQYTYCEFLQIIRTCIFRPMIAVVFFKKNIFIISLFSGHDPDFLGVSTIRNGRSSYFVWFIFRLDEHKSFAVHTPEST